MRVGTNIQYTGSAFFVELNSLSGKITSVNESNDMYTCVFRCGTYHFPSEEISEIPLEPTDYVTISKDSKLYNKLCVEVGVIKEITDSGKVIVDWGIGETHRHSNWMLNYYDPQVGEKITVVKGPTIGKNGKILLIDEEGEYHIELNNGAMEFLTIKEFILADVNEREPSKDEIKEEPVRGFTKAKEVGDINKQPSIDMVKTLECGGDEIDIGGFPCKWKSEGHTLWILHEQNVFTTTFYGEAGDFMRANEGMISSFFMHKTDEGADTVLEVLKAAQMEALKKIDNMVIDVTRDLVLAKVFETTSEYITAIGERLTDKTLKEKFLGALGKSK